MNIIRKYPQKFKKQHKNRAAYEHKFVVPDIKSSNKLRWVSLSPEQGIVLPKRTVSFLRKSLRKFFKKKKIKCCFMIQPNKVLTTKSKNSRMGKGVGTINRSAYQVYGQKSMIILANVSYKRVKLVAKYLSKRLQVKLNVNYKN